MLSASPKIGDTPWSLGTNIHLVLRLSMSWVANKAPKVSVVKCR